MQLFNLYSGKIYTGTKTQTTNSTTIISSKGQIVSANSSTETNIKTTSTTINPETVRIISTMTNTNSFIENIKESGPLAMTAIATLPNHFPVMNNFEYYMRDLTNEPWDPDAAIGVAAEFLIMSPQKEKFTRAQMVGYIQESCFYNGECFEQYKRQVDDFVRPINQDKRKMLSLDYNQIAISSLKINCIIDMKNVVYFSAIILIIYGCKLKNSIDKNFNVCNEEKWTEYVVPFNESLDTNKVKGQLIKEIILFCDGNSKRVIEYNPSNGIFKRITEYENDSMVSMVKTYFDDKGLFGNIKKSEYDNKGHLVKEILYSVNNGKENIEGVFNITNELDKTGHILYSSVETENDSLQSYSIYNTYEKGFLINCSIKDNSGKLISENSYIYNEKGLVVSHVLKLPDLETVKEFFYKYKDGKKVEEVEIVNNDTIRINQFYYHDGKMNKIVRKNIRENAMHIINIETQALK